MFNITKFGPETRRAAIGRPLFFASTGVISTNDLVASLAPIHVNR